MRQTYQDPTKRHQVIVCCNEPKHTASVAITCNCMPYRGPGAHPQHMGVAQQLNDVWRIYNNPANHALPFGEEDVVYVKGIGSMV